MSLKGENPITSYFPRLSPNSKRKTPTQSKQKLAKRVRQPDEVDSSEESSRKKSKSRKQKNLRKIAVIEIEDTPPSSPVKPRVLLRPTPPSSPLTDLTPSPEPPPRIRSPSLSSLTDVWVDDAELGPSYSSLIGASHSECREHEHKLIPSSQTQELVNEEEPGVAQVPALPSSRIPFQSSESYTPQTLSYIPYSQLNTTPSDSDELVASPQTQLLDPIPRPSISPDFDFVSSSQSQEHSYSQTVANQPHWDMRFVHIISRCLFAF
jgi:hypothetical protein